MNITFLPYSDVKDFSQAAKEYQDIWKTDGEKITNFWQKIEKRMQRL